MPWDSLLDWLFTRAWSLDRFMPSLLTLLIAAFGTSTLRKSLEDEIRERTRTAGQADATINAAVTWHLSLAVLTAFLSFFPSWFGLFRTNDTLAWFGVLVFGFLGAVYVLVPVLRAPLGTLNEQLTTEPPIEGVKRSWLETRLAKKERTWADFYRSLVLYGHSLLLLGNVVTTPAKTP